MENAPSYSHNRLDELMPSSNSNIQICSSQDMTWLSFYYFIYILSENQIKNDTVNN